MLSNKKDTDPGLSGEGVPSQKKKRLGLSRSGKGVWGIDTRPVAASLL